MTSPPRSWSVSAEMAQAPEDLERFLLGFEEAWRVGAQPVQRVAPAVGCFGPRMNAVAGRIELDRLPGHLFDQRSLCEMVFERLAGREQPVSEFKEPELEERVLLIPPDSPDTVLGAQVPEKEEQDQGVGLVALHLQEAAGAYLLTFGFLPVAEVLSAKKVAGKAGRHPDRLAAPLSGGRQRVDLFSQPLEPLRRDAVPPVMNDSRPGCLAYPVIRLPSMIGCCHGSA